ncbi:hypothetical protein [Streptomyces sp. NPDC056549]|uniref:hypothetical protein n=1 Tax=Streptomyces sp. NPDC056549 TaxID=3345864 RepID=UPI0036AF71D1
MPLTDPARGLLDGGHATIPLNAKGIEALAELRTQAARFFTQDEKTKLRHGGDDFNFGYRPYGRQYSVSPDRPDMNSSFVYRADDPTAIPYHKADTIAPFLTALGAYWRVAAAIADQVLAGLASHYGYRGDLQFRIETDAQMRQAAVGAGRLLVMPGSVLTAMTDGQIPPLYHQVRNHGLKRCITTLFMVNPGLNGNVIPYTGGAVDIAALARTSGSMFGLPPAPVPAPPTA